MQWPGVRRVKGLFQLKNLIWLDPCDEHRDDREFVKRTIFKRKCKAARMCPVTVLSADAAAFFHLYLILYCFLEHFGSKKHA